MSDPEFYSVPYWQDEREPLAWDTLILAGETWPGVASITGTGIVRKIDVKKAGNTDGATIKDEGIELARIDITLRIYSRGDWELLQRLLPTIAPRKKGGARTPLEIIHPTATLLGLRYIYVTEIPIPEMDRSTQILTVTIKAIEYAPAPAPVKKAAGGAAGGDNIAVGQIVDAMLADYGAEEVEEFLGSAKDVADEGFDDEQFTKSSWAG